MIKAEPHTKAKIDAKRYRLISVLSLVDQMVDRCLFYPMVRAEIDNFQDVPGKTGWSPIPGGYALLENVFGGEVLATDCSAFDWTFPPWLVDLTLDIRLDMMRSCSQEFERAARNRWHEVLGTDCVLRLPDGTRLRQRVPGIMKSGWLETISVNSEAQDLITSLAWARTRSDPYPKLWAMGDDVLMAWPGGDHAPLVAAISELGILTKIATHRRDFAGFNFALNGLVTPLYTDKHRFILAHASASQLEEMCSAYGLLYALSSDADRLWVKDLVVRYGRWPWRVCKHWARGTLSTLLTRTRPDAVAEFYRFWD